MLLPYMPGIVSYKIRDRLVEGSPYRDKIKELIKNLRLGTMAFNDNEFSNCFGTVIWILGLEEKIISEPENINFNFVEGRPGYVDEDVMESFLKNYTGEVSLKDATFLCSWWHFPSVSKLMHAVLNLGEYKGYNVIFHQNGRAGIFDFGLYGPSDEINSVEIIGYKVSI